jgi:hypothetical protein
LPPPAQLASPPPPVKLHVPTTTPLLRVPAVVIVPFDVPVRFPDMVRVLPAGVTDTTVKLSEPVTWSAELVTRVALPLWVVPRIPFAKHFPALMKLNPKIVSGPEVIVLLLFNVNVVTKFSRLA